MQVTTWGGVQGRKGQCAGNTVGWCGDVQGRKGHCAGNTVGWCGDVQGRKGHCVGNSSNRVWWWGGDNVLIHTNHKYIGSIKEGKVSVLARWCGSVVW